DPPRRATRERSALEKCVGEAASERWVGERIRGSRLAAFGGRGEEELIGGDAVVGGDIGARHAELLWRSAPLHWNGVGNRGVQNRTPLPSEPALLREKVGELAAARFRSEEHT